MEFAIVLSGHRHGPNAADLMLRPFGASSLLERAIDKLAALDVPCRKYVASPDREIRALVADSIDLTPVRASHLLQWQSPEAEGDGFDHLRQVAAEYVLLVNPAYPFVEADVWWQVIEDFLAVDPESVVSAHDVRGPFYTVDGRTLDGQEPRYVRNDAFVLAARNSLISAAGRKLLRPTPWVIGSDASRPANHPSELTALESLDAVRGLAPFA